MARRKRRGFTLVELLVVISIIGMLAALLLPAVNQAREAGRRTVCLSNIKQLGLAVIQFEQRAGKYPGYVNAQAIDPVSKHATRPVGWAFALMPFLERNDIAENYGTAGMIQQPALLTPTYAMDPAQVIAVLLCPSDVRGPQVGNSYVANCGLKDFDGVGNNTTYQGFPRDNQANGVFQFNYPYLYSGATTGLSWPSLYASPYYYSLSSLYSTSAPPSDTPNTSEKVVQQSASYITGGDGTSTTLMLSENVDCASWSGIYEGQVGFVWQASVDAGGICNPATGGTSYDYLTGNSVAMYKINQNVGQVDGVSGILASTSGTTPNSEYQFYRPSSFHTGSVNVVFCGGNATNIADGISYLVYSQLMTPRGKFSQQNYQITSGSAPVQLRSLGTTGVGQYGTATLNEGDYAPQ